MDKVFKPLSEFKGRDVELFRSSDLNNTAIYFTDINWDKSNIKQEDAKSFFEILRFGFNGGYHQIYVRFPETDYFIEMHGGGFGSGRGDMKQSDGKNVWEDEYKSTFNIYSHGQNLIFLIGGNDSMFEFNFMTKVSSYDKGNPYDSLYPNEKSVNYHEIEEALSLNYLAIPESIRALSYCMKTTGDNPIYFMIDYPAYNFNYDNQRFFKVESLHASDDEFEEFKITKFERFRDGGTTKINIIDKNGNEHSFFSPQKMFPTKEKLVAKFDETELIDVTEEEKDILIDILKIDLIKL